MDSESSILGESLVKGLVEKMIAEEYPTKFSPTTAPVLGAATQRFSARKSKRFVPPALHIRSTKAFLFCRECFTLKVSGLEITPATTMSCFFCPSCQSEAHGRLEKAQTVMDNLKETTEENLIKELKESKSSVPEEQAREVIAKIKKEYEEWSDTQTLMGSAYLFSVEDVIAIFTEAQVREFMTKDLELGMEEKRPMSEKVWPTSGKVSVPLDPYKTLICQLFMDVHRERVAHNENLEEHITNKGF